MSTPIYTVDAFTSAPFKGNPAGVCLLEVPADPAWMQSIAREKNLSETAFLVPQTGGYGLRWFTPAAEVDLCGHATLASAHILFETGRVDRANQARFHTRSGLLTAKSCADGWIELNFPAKPILPEAVPGGLAEALNTQPVYVGKNVFDYLVELADEDQVRRLSPDIAALKELPVRGVIVTARGSGGYDFVSRFFAPAVGVDEDPVTGSAHCCLAPYWAEKLGKHEFQAYQASARGGELKVRLEGERVFLTGQAVTVFEGSIHA